MLENGLSFHIYSKDRALNNILRSAYTNQFEHHAPIRE